jgi:HD-like signal output (HDOD) protein
MSKTALNRLLASGHLPALPHSAIRILELAKNPENGPLEFARPIEADAGLTSQVLRFVNSSYFGFAREISNVKLALTLVGVRTIKNFTLWSAVFSLMPNPRCGSFSLRSLWQDSLRRALFARSIAAALRIRETEEAFAAALLQDMAIPLLAREFADDYEPLFHAREHGQKRLSRLEHDRFGWTHADAAAAIAEHWNLPAELIRPIQEHVDLQRSLEAERPGSIDLAVALSAFLPASVDGAWPECGELTRHFKTVFPDEPMTLADLLRETDADFERFAPVLHLTTPVARLEELYHEAISPSETSAAVVSGASGAR